MNASSQRKLEIESDGTERLDVLLQRKLSQTEEQEISRSFVQKLIASGAVKSISGILSKPSEKIKGQLQLEIDLTSLQSPQLAPFKFDLEILHEDQQLIVINKPAGISMHPGAGDHNTTLVNALVHYLGANSNQDFPNDQRPGVVHRLDRDTTGIVVVAKDRHTLFSLARQFAARSVERRYLALAFTPPRRASLVRQHDHGVIDRPLRRSQSNRTKIEVCEQAGRRAITNFKVKERFTYAALVELKLETGRTHQIRVHLDSVGSPIIGDRQYGNFTGLAFELSRRATDFGRQALHAELLAFDHPVSKQRLRFMQAPPLDFLELVEAFRV